MDACRSLYVVNIVPQEGICGFIGWVGLGEDAGAVEAGGVVPEDSFFTLVGDGLVQEFGEGHVGGGSIGVGIVGVPDEVAIADDADDGGKGLFVGVACHEYLALEEFGGCHFQVVVVPEDGLASDGVVVEASEPEGEPAGVALEEAGAEGGVFLQDTGIDEVAHGDHVFHGEADGVIQGEEGAGFAPIAGAGVGIAAASAVEDYGDVEFGDEIPEGVVLRVVPELAFLGSGHHDGDSS